MSWVERLSGTTVALDSAPLMYFMEGNADFFEPIRPFFDALVEGNFKALTSTVTIAEALVYPLRHGQFNLLEAYRNFFAQYLTVFPVTPEIAEIAAGLRAEHRGLRTPDALQLATAIEHKADFFLTNDIRLGHLKPPEVLLLSQLL